MYFILPSPGLTQVLLKATTRILNARQLSLKFVLNVTYGYTSASFSGRMPAVEIADDIVQSGRETLEKVALFSFPLNMLSLIPPLRLSG